MKSQKFFFLLCVCAIHVGACSLENSKATPFSNEKNKGRNADGGISTERAITESCRHDDRAFRCVDVLKNYDGDTLTVNIPKIHPLFGSKVSVRVLGIDTPEVKTTDACEKSAGRAARKLVSSVLSRAKKVDLLNVSRDKYFRILADVYLDGENLKDLLLKNNLAYPYDGGTKKKIDWCQRMRMPASR